MSSCTIDIINSVARACPVSGICMKCILQSAVVDTRFKSKWLLT